MGNFSPHLNFLMGVELEEVPLSHDRERKKQNRPRNSRACDKRLLMVARQSDGSFMGMALFMGRFMTHGS